MPTWLTQLFTAISVAQSIVLYAMVIAVGIALYKLRITGIFPGATGVLFMGISFLPYVVMRIIASKFFRKTYLKYAVCWLAPVPIRPHFRSPSKWPVTISLREPMPRYIPRR